MNTFEKFTAHEPMECTVTSTTWGGWPLVGSECFRCAHSVVRFDRVSCQLASRTLVRTANGDMCASYKRRGGVAE